MAEYTCAVTGAVLTPGRDPFAIFSVRVMQGPQGIPLEPEAASTEVAVGLSALGGVGTALDKMAVDLRAAVQRAEREAEAIEAIAADPDRS